MLSRSAMTSFCSLAKACGVSPQADIRSVLAAFSRTRRPLFVRAHAHLPLVLRVALAFDMAHRFQLLEDGRQRVRLQEELFAEAADGLAVRSDSATRVTYWV